VEFPFAFSLFTQNFCRHFLRFSTRRIYHLLKNVRMIVKKQNI
jgi:hypothetical protein